MADFEKAKTLANTIQSSHELDTTNTDEQQEIIPETD